MRVLVRTSKNSITDEKALEVSGNMKKYQVLQEELKNAKPGIKAPERIVIEKLIDKLVEMFGELDDWMWDELEEDEQVIILNSMIRKLKLIRKITKRDH